MSVPLTRPLCSFPPGEVSLALGKPESWKCATAPKWDSVGVTHCGKQPPAGSSVRDVTRKELQGTDDVPGGQEPLQALGDRSQESRLRAQWAPSEPRALVIWVVWSQASSCQRAASTQPAPGPSPKSRKIIFTVEKKERRRNSSFRGQSGWQCCGRWPGIRANGQALPNRGYGLRAGGQKPLNHRRAQMSVCNHSAAPTGIGPIPPRRLLERCPWKASACVPLGGSPDRLGIPL